MSDEKTIQNPELDKVAGGIGTHPMPPGGGGTHPAPNPILPTPPVPPTHPVGPPRDPP
jgi:hypothetical protein